MKLLTRDQALELADSVEKTHPELAAKIRARISDYDKGLRADINIQIDGQITVEKYDGEYSPDKQPTETIVREGI